MKRIFTLVLPVLFSMMICVGLLFLTSLIPKSAIEKNCKDSAAFYMKNELFDSVFDGYFFTKQDNYADCILNNVVYHIDEKHPVVSSLKASYYNPKIENVNDSFIKAVSENEIKDKAENTVDYYRYWHGSMVFLRPLFVFLNIVQIRMLLGVLAIMGGLLSVLVLCLQNRRAMAVCYLFSMLFVDIWMTCFCIEYVTTFLVLNGVMLVLFKKLSKGKEITEKSFFSLFAISGVVTAFVDFLTTETITFSVPVFLLLVYLFESGRLSKIKDSFIFLIQNGISWMLGYASMFLLKWFISAILFGKAAMLNSLSQAAVRIKGEVNLGQNNMDPVADKSQQLLGAWWHNLGCLYHIKDTLNEGTIFLTSFLIILISFSLIYLFHTKKIEGAFLLPAVVLFFLPFLRYLVLSNHSYLHYFFTYRAMLISVFIFLYLIWEYALMGIFKLVCHKKTKKKRA